MKFAAVAIVLANSTVNAQDSQNVYMSLANKHEFLLLRTTPEKERKTFEALKCASSINFLYTQFPEEKTPNSLLGKVNDRAIAQLTSNYPDPMHAIKVSNIYGKSWAMMLTNNKMYNVEQYHRDIQGFREYVAECDKNLDVSPSTTRKPSLSAFMKEEEKAKPGAEKILTCTGAGRILVDRLGSSHNQYEEIKAMSERAGIEGAKLYGTSAAFEQKVKFVIAEKSRGLDAALNEGRSADVRAFIGEQNTIVKGCANNFK